MAGKREQKNKLLDQLVYSGGGTRENQLAKAKRRVFRSAALTVLVLGFASVAFWISFGWLAPPSQNVDAGGQGVTSDGVAATTGYDVYKCDEDDLNRNGDIDEGININANYMTMNLYDRILLGRNDRTPLILRAVLSPGYSTAVETGKNVKLTIRCASDSLDKELYDIDGDGVKEEVHWLSNVVEVSADYIPEIMDNVEAGTIPAQYRSADDYIYHTAINHFAAMNDDYKFNFVTDGELSDPGLPGSVKQKTVSLDLDLDNAVCSSNGYYYMYFMIDYEPTLVSDYMATNNMEIHIGSESSQSYKFEDIFLINAEIVD